MRVGRRRGEVAIAGESLGKQKIPGHSVEVGYLRMAKRLEPEETIESGFFLPVPEDVLGSPQ